jgi:hypothetical protein
VSRTGVPGENWKAVLFRLAQPLAKLEFITGTIGVAARTGRPSVGIRDLRCGWDLHLRRMDPEVCSRARHLWPTVCLSSSLHLPEGDGW